MVHAHNPLPPSLASVLDGPSGTESLTRTQLAQAREFVTRLLVDRLQLDEYFEHLHTRFRDNRLAGARHLLGSWAVSLPDNRPLNPAEVERILSAGPSAFDRYTAAEIVRLLRNPAGLQDLAEQIDGLLPDAWEAAILADAKRGHVAEPERKPKPAWFRRPTTAIAAGVLIGFVAGSAVAAFATFRAIESNSNQAMANAKTDPGKTRVEVGSSGAIEFHVAKGDRPADWKLIWTASSRGTPEERVNRIYELSGANIKAEIDDYRRQKYEAHEILTFLRLRYGPHE